MIKDYFYIQEKRFGPRIKLELDIKVDQQTTMIPTFTLQPLVENAIIHGVGPKEDGGIVRIEIYPERGSIYIVVMDTGMGIGREKLQLMNEDIRNGGGKNIGMGIVNVFERCRIHYSESTFEVFSENGSGTRIFIELRKEGVTYNV